jgi:hypothetical protein
MLPVTHLNAIEKNMALFKVVLKATLTEKGKYHSLSYITLKTITHRPISLYYMPSSGYFLN